MVIKTLSQDEDLWGKVALYARKCSWQTTGEYLANRMLSNGFTDWERVFVALEDNCIMGFCALSKSTAVFGDIYTPDIGFLFVGEHYRGKKLVKIYALLLSNMQNQSISIRHISIAI